MGSMRLAMLVIAAGVVVRVAGPALLGAQGNSKLLGYGLMLGPDAEDSYNDDQASVIIDLPGRTLHVIGQAPPVEFASL